MAIPSALQAQIAALNVAFTAASPVEQSPRAAITALQINAATLVPAVDSALAGAAGALDTFTAPALATDMATGLVGLLTASQNQTDLADLRGLAGRVASNLDQV
jgi:hypothetical protein